MFRLARSTVAVSSATQLGLLGLVLGLPLALCGQDAKPAAPAQPAATVPASAPSVEESWDSLLQGTIPQAKVDPTLIPTQVGGQKSAASDFANHFFFENRTDYWRYDTSFTGLPTNSGIINGNAAASLCRAPTRMLPISSPTPIVSRALWIGVRGWLSDRVNTHFAVRYEQDLTHVDSGSPSQQHPGDIRSESAL